MYRVVHCVRATVKTGCTTHTRKLNAAMPPMHFSIASSMEFSAIKKHREMMEKIEAFKRDTTPKPITKADANAANVTDIVVKPTEDMAPVEPVVSTKQHIMNAILSDLSVRGEVHDQTMRVIEGSEEWKDYDAHVSFELMMLKHRYQNSNIPMTAARRTQMQAHIRQKQREVMAKHAEATAEEYIESLTESEKQRLRQWLLTIETPVSDAEKAQSIGQNNTNDSDSFALALQELAKEISAMLTAPATKQNAKARPEMPDNFAGKTLDEIRDIFDEREEMFSEIGFNSPHVASRKR